MTLTVKGTLFAPSTEIAARVASGVEEHVRLSREEPGNISFTITQLGPDRWEVDEEFTDAAAFEAHRQRTAASEFAKLAEGIERDLQISDSEAS